MATVINVGNNYEYEVVKRNGSHYVVITAEIRKDLYDRLNPDNCYGEWIDNVLTDGEQIEP